MDLPTPQTEQPEDSPQYFRDSRRRWMQWTVCILLVLATIISFCPAMLSVTRYTDFVQSDSTTSGQQVDGVFLLGNVFTFDWVNTGEVNVVWSLSGYGSYALPIAQGFENPSPPANVPVDVYLNDPTKPAFSYDPSHLPVTDQNDTLPVRSLLSFKMAHEIDFTNYGYAPTDWYSFSSFFFAIDTATNKSIPIIGSEIVNAGSNSFSMISRATPSKSNFVNNGSSTTVVVDSMTLFAKIQRPVAALAITYSMFAINWVLAIFSIVAAAVASFWEVDIVVALLPITIILTVPTLRAIYVSAPFGVFLDVVGFFPQMLIVVSCTVLALSSYGIGAIRDGRLTSGSFKEGLKRMI